MPDSTNQKMKLLFILLTLSALVTSSFGVIGYLACTTACNAAAAACYLAAGLVIGTVTLGVGAPSAAIACSAAQSACWLACGASAVGTGCICVIS